MRVDSEFSLRVFNLYNILINILITTYFKIFRILLKISEKEAAMFGSYSNTSKYFLRDYVTIAVVFFSQ